MGLSLQCREVLKGRVPGVTRGYHGGLEVTLGYRELPGSTRGDQEYYSGSGRYQKDTGVTRCIPEVYQGEPGFTKGQVLPWGTSKVGGVTKFATGTMGYQGSLEVYQEIPMVTRGPWGARGY
jgi:hypothetical protein